MPEQEFDIASFKYGLDTRREALSSLVGTLVTCQNGYINQGGEIEKRKAFGIYGSLDIFDSLGNPGFFGIESTDSGIVAYTHALAFGATVTQGQPTLVSAVPAGLVHQQLKHPTLVNDSAENFDTNYHRMTGIASSDSFNGKSFVAATFSDGRTFLYYDGTHVQHSSNGVVMENRIALADLAKDIARQITAIGWTAQANRTEVVLDSLTKVGTLATANYVGHGLSNGDIVEIRGALVATVANNPYNGRFVISGVVANVSFQYTMHTDPGANADASTVNGPFATVLQNGSVLVDSPTSDFFGGVPSETAASGQLGIKSVAESGVGTTGAGALACFQILNIVNGSFTLTAPENSDGTGSVDLCGGAVPVAATVIATATSIVKAINDLTFIHGYSANNFNPVSGLATDSVYVNAKSSWGPFAFNLTVTPNASVGVCAVAPPLTLSIGNDGQIQFVPVTVNVTPLPIRGQMIYTAQASGGVKPYSFLFELVTSGANPYLSLRQPSQFQTYVDMNRPGNVRTVQPADVGNYYGVFKCTVTDAIGTKTTVTFSAGLTLFTF